MPLSQRDSFARGLKMQARMVHGSSWTPDVAKLMDSLVADGKKRLEAASEGLGEAAKRSISSTENKIHDRPFMSIALMFLAGLLLGRLIFRS